ncbi:MAG: RNA polymerase sigma factor RpoD/SigA [Treponema sp.]|jgi:RNA polymerase primary sigma factor|nr:RNA polymerase sigma factor RpoD/SigA [Treponema sp.]
MSNVKEGRREKESTKTEPDENCFALYLKEIGGIPLLSREEEEKIARSAALGDKAARERLANANLRFVVKVAKKYRGMGLSFEDLICEGNVGLLNAIDRFDVEKGCHFISYAVWWIRQSILSALYEKSRMIRLPVNWALELSRIEQARKLIKNRISFEDEVEEIAKFLNTEKDHVMYILNISREMLSLEKPVSIGTNLVLGDFIEDRKYAAPDKCAERNILEIEIERILSTLDSEEADIIRCHYGLGNRPVMSLKEIGDRYNLSKERIRQIEVKALSRLQNPLRKKKLQIYVA